MRMHELSPPKGSVRKQARTRHFDPASGSPHAVRFASERGALEFFAGDDELAGRVPHLVAVDEEYGVIVMDDLGNVPSLADVLLGDDPVRARALLLDYERLIPYYQTWSHCIDNELI